MCMRALHIRVGNSLFCSSLFRSKSLILKSDRQWFAHVALYKRANSSLIQANRTQKTSDSPKKFVFFVYIWRFFPFLCPWANRSRCSSLPRSFLKSEVRNSLRSLITKSDHERVAHIALYKRATVSDLLRSLMTKGHPWAIRSRRSLQKSDRSNSLFLKSELLFCSQKTSELLEKPMSKFPTLLHTHIRSTMHSLVKNTYICEHCIPLLATHCIVW